MNRRARAAIPCVVALVALGGCADSKEAGSSAGSTWPSPAPTSPGSAPATAQAGRNRSDLVNTYQPPSPIASITGTDKISGNGQKVTIEVLSLTATKGSTVMQTRIIPEKEIDPFLADSWQNVECLDRVTLLDKATGKVYRPGGAAKIDPKDNYRRCLGAPVPNSASKEKPLYHVAYYGPLPENLTEITLHVEGYTEAKVPITRK